MQRFIRALEENAIFGSFIGKNSEVMAECDPLIIDGNGYLDVQTTPGTTTKIVGWKIGAETMASDNQTVDKVRPQMIFASMNVHLRFPSDIDCEQKHIGGWNNFTSGSLTGAHTIDLTAATQGTDGCCFIIDRDPERISDNDVVIVCASEPQPLFSQA